LTHEDKIILIRGNHEDLMQDMINRNYNTSGDLYNGTADTIVDLYPQWLVTEFDLKKIAKETGLQKVLDLCVDYFETEHYIFVHGWIPCFTEGFRPYVKYKFNPDWRNAEVHEWRSARWFNGMELACKHRITEANKTIVCGHWHTSYGHSFIDRSCSEWGKDADFSPFSAEGILAIDASTPNSLTVNCVVIED